MIRPNAIGTIRKETQIGSTVDCKRIHSSQLLFPQQSKIMRESVFFLIYICFFFYKSFSWFCSANWSPLCHHLSLSLQSCIYILIYIISYLCALFYVNHLNLLYLASVIPESFTILKLTQESPPHPHFGKNFVFSLLCYNLDVIPKPLKNYILEAGFIKTPSPCPFWKWSPSVSRFAFLLKLCKKIQI